MVNTFVAAAAAIATASVAFAQAIDNTAVAASIFAQAASITSSSGDYYITNVGNGKSLYFTRTSVTNVYPQSGRQPINVEKYGAVPGTYILSGLNKCMSAQWGFQHLRGETSSSDNAAVSYACAIGSNKVPSTVELPKQAWIFVPATGCGGGSSSSDDSSVGVSVQLNAQVSSSSNDDDAAAEEEDDDDEEEAAPAAAAPVKASSSRKQQGSAKKASSGSTSGVIKSDRTTWVCRHPGWWLLRHPGYVTRAGHVECQDELDAARAGARLARRSRSARHQAIKRSIVAEHEQEKRALGGCYNIITSDHIYDMATKAVTGETMATPGSYTSAALDFWDPTDAGQKWIVTPA